MSSTVPYIRTRLSVMMFLEFGVWASWFMAIGAYLNDVLGFSGSQVTWIYATTAIGAIVAPMFVGFVADRYFATERILAVLHLVGGLCMLWASRQTGFAGLMTLLVINGMCYMPTLALCNSVAFRNIDDPNRFSRIAVWGTIGWILAVAAVDFVLGGAQTGRFFYLAGIGGIVMALYSLTLPHTPPKGAADQSADVFGLKALRLFRDPGFLAFAGCAFLICIPATYFFNWSAAFLAETERPLPTALTALAQVSEILVMMIMPWFIAEFGLKAVLVIGMAAWAIRYFLFATLSFPLIILALLLHGFCYCFVFVAAFIYVRRKAPPELSASAQSLVALLLWGLGMFVGNQISGMTADAYAPAQMTSATKWTKWLDKEVLADKMLLPNWPAVKQPAQQERASLAGATGELVERPVLVDASEQVVVIGPVKVLGELPKDKLVLETKATVKDESGQERQEVVATISYPAEQLLAAYQSADANGDNVVTHEEWQAVRTHRWPPIWLWPAALATVVCVLFIFTGRDVAEEGEPAPPAEQPREAEAPLAEVPLAGEPVPAEPVPEGPPAAGPAEPGPSGLTLTPEEPPPASPPPHEPPPEQAPPQG